jgi:hypothetical protein
MGTLFESASHVRAWTGMPTDGVPRLFDLASEPDWSGEQSSGLEFYNSERRRWTRARFMVEDLEALSGFAKRDYWHRTWIVQELALAGSVIVACGSSRCSLREIQTLLRISRMEAAAMSDDMASDWAQAIIDSPLQYHKSMLPKERLIERSSRQRSSGSLESLLQSYGGTRCMDSRDRIYALRALASDVREHSLCPDYSKDRTDLFRDVLDVCAARNIDFLRLLKQSLGATSSLLMENVESTEEKGRVGGNMGNLCPTGELPIQEIVTNTDAGLDFARCESPDGWKGVTMAQVGVHDTVWVMQEGHYSDVSNNSYHDTYASGEIPSVSTQMAPIKLGLVVERGLCEPTQPKCCWALLSREPATSDETRLSRLELMHDICDIPPLSGHPARIDIIAGVVMVLLLFDSIRRGEPVFEVPKRTKTL